MRRVVEIVGGLEMTWNEVSSILRIPTLVLVAETRCAMRAGTGARVYLPPWTFGKHKGVDAEMVASLGADSK